MRFQWALHRGPWPLGQWEQDVIFNADVLRRSQAPGAANQLQDVRVAAVQVARVALAATSHQIVLTHCNGPQVGLMASQSAAYTAVDSYMLAGHAGTQITADAG